MHPMTATRLAAVTLLCALLPASLAVAAVPSTLGIEGRITASTGAPVADGVYALTFRLYATQSAQQALWTEIAAKISVKGATFRHGLGTISKLDAKQLASAAWLGLQVAKEPELARQRLHSAPFARLAASAHGLACTGCVSMSALKIDGDLDLGGNAIKAKVISAGSMQAQAVTAGAFIGDGSKLTGVGAKAGNCPAGKVVTGIAGDGSLVCASTAGALPKDGLEQVSNGVLTNVYIASASSKNTPVKIEDNNPIGVYDTIDLPDIGNVGELSVSVKLTSSDISGLEVILYDPNNAKYVLHDKSGSGKSLDTSWPKPTKLVSGNLGAWNGKNPKGKWRLRIVDAKFLNNGIDGALLSWSVGGGGLSNKVVTGKGVVWGKGGLQTQASAGPPAKCSALLTGRLYIDTAKGGFYICDGGDWRKVIMEGLCGNKVVNSDETCDDGNLVTGDGCTAKCQKNVCGDGIVWIGKEECDDGNKIDADACGNTCKANFKAVAFSNCGQTSKTGPSQNQCNGVYNGTTLAGKVTVASGIQQWTVPATGTYRIEAWGAQGGKGVLGAGGKGARMRGDFLLQAGTKLNIIVGQAGHNNNKSKFNAGSGGGGSFVWKANDTAKPILAAGGGGGSGGQQGTSHLGVGGTTAANGTNANGKNPSTGGVDGHGGNDNGGTHSHGGAAGGGWKSAGKDNVSAAQGGRSILNEKAVGGNWGSYGSHGGFGGGGGSNIAGGGGGGWSGGASGNQPSGWHENGGGGGGSLNQGANQSNTANVQTGHGKVTISLP